MSESLTLHLQHASSRFTLTPPELTADFRAAFNRGADVVGFTEIRAKRDLLSLVAHTAGYEVSYGQPGDVAIAVKSVHTVTDFGQVDSVPAHANPRGHAARPVLWVTFTPLGTKESVTVHEAHWVTRKSDRGGQQVQLTEDLAATVAGHAGGARIGLWMGDTNNPDRPHDLTPVDRAFVKGALTSCWDELGTYPDTKGAITIDVIGSYDPDRRVQCLRAKRWPKGNSDHRAVSAWYVIQRVRT